jgi:hypothetical protein
MITISLDELGEWARDLVIVLSKYPAPLLDSLYHHMKKYRRETGRTWNSGMEATIRNVLQRHCRKSPQYQHKYDLFERIDGGCWGLRPGIKIKN